MVCSRERWIEGGMSCRAVPDRRIVDKVRIRRAHELVEGRNTFRTGRRDGGEV
jgi:hypothetical protein